MQVTKFNLVTDLKIMLSNVTHSHFYFECNKERGPIDQLYIELGYYLIMKYSIDLKGLYEPGKRHWLKVKKDYLNEGAMADSADLVVLGAWHGKFTNRLVPLRNHPYITSTELGA